MQRNTTDISNNYTSEGVKVSGCPNHCVCFSSSGLWGAELSPGQRGLSPVSSAAQLPALLPSITLSCCLPGWLQPPEACPSLCLPHQLGAKPLLNIKVRSSFHPLQAP